MPRIPIRTTPYHTTARQTRHYKNKRDLALKSLGKSAYINGGQFVIAWITPKGEVESFASEMLQGVLERVVNHEQLQSEAHRIGDEQERRREELRIVAERGEDTDLAKTPARAAYNSHAVYADEDDEDLEDEDEDGDRTLVDDDHEISSRLPLACSSKSPSPGAPSDPVLCTPMNDTVYHTLQLAYSQLPSYYENRFNDIQQTTCKLIVKAWIKIIEPKKQNRFPYKAGEAGRPDWWPVGVQHREPDHLSKADRVTLLTQILRSPRVTVPALELSTAEVGAFISPARLVILREVYQVAREEEKRRRLSPHQLDTSDLVVQLSSASAPPTESPVAYKNRKRALDAHGALSISQRDNMASSPLPAMGSYAVHSQKRAKRSGHPNSIPPILSLSRSNTEPSYNTSPFTYAPQPSLSQWREQSVASPYDSPAESASASIPHMASDLQADSWPSARPSMSQRRTASGLGVPQSLQRSNSYGLHLQPPRREPSSAALVSPTESVHSPYPTNYYQQAVYSQPAPQVVVGYPHQDLNYGTPYLGDSYHMSHETPRAYSVDHHEGSWAATPTESL